MWYQGEEVSLSRESLWQSKHVGTAAERIRLMLASGAARVKHLSCAGEDRTVAALKEYDSGSYAPPR